MFCSWGKSIISLWSFLSAYVSHMSSCAILSSGVSGKGCGVKPGQSVFSSGGKSEDLGVCSQYVCEAEYPDAFALMGRGGMEHDRA